jgi:hypothetical protein
MLSELQGLKLLIPVKVIQIACKYLYGSPTTNLDYTRSRGSNIPITRLWLTASRKFLLEKLTTIYNRTPSWVHSTSSNPLFKSVYYHFYSFSLSWFLPSIFTGYNSACISPLPNSCGVFLCLLTSLQLMHNDVLPHQANWYSSNVI